MKIEKNILQTPFVFSTRNLSELADTYKNEYAHGSPFPNIAIDDFLPLEVADSLLTSFPSIENACWLERDKINHPKKFGVGHASKLEGLSPYLHAILFAFNSFPFLNFLEQLTGIKKLLPDPHFSGGAIHQTVRGGRLEIHTDFNYLERLSIYRRINVIFYLNKQWQDDYSGHLELWDKEKRRCEKKISPLFNRIAIFATNKQTFHGHPAPLNTPEGITRKSLALYYYTSQPAEGETYNQHTEWR